MAVPNNKELGRVSGGLVLLSTGEWYFCPDWSKGELRWCNSLVAKISMCPCRHFFILRAAKNDFPSDVIYSALAFLDLQFMTFHVLAYFIGEKSSRMAVWFGKFAELRCVSFHLSFVIQSMPSPFPWASLQIEDCGTCIQRQVFTGPIYSSLLAAHVALNCSVERMLLRSTERSTAHCCDGWNPKPRRLALGPPKTVL